MRSTPKGPYHFQKDENGHTVLRIPMADLPPEVRERIRNGEEIIPTDVKASKGRLEFNIGSFNLVLKDHLDS
jgi:hypothetical protein